MVPSFFSNTPWLSIRCAPLDGTRVLGGRAGSVGIIFHNAHGWFSESTELSMWRSFPPTHWLNLPTLSGPGWSRLSSVPRDGTPVLVANRSRMGVVWFHNNTIVADDLDLDGWVSDDDPLLVWMALPEPPPA